MSRGEEDRGRVLIVVSDRDPVGNADDRVASLQARLGSETVVRRGATAVEYVRELGPTIDCVAVLDDDPSLVELLAGVETGVPMLVYGETDADVDDVVPPSAGVDTLADCISREVSSDRERSELVEANAKLTALSRHANAITGCQTVEEVCEQTLDAAVDALAFTFCVVALVEGDYIVPRTSTLREENQTSCRLDEGVAGRTLQTGETQRVDDLHADEDARFRDTFRSVVSVPLGQYGVIQVVSDDVGHFGERDAEFLEILAGYTTETLSRLDRESALRQERDRLHAFFESLPVPALYVEEDPVVSDYVRCETNAAYDRTFGVSRGYERGTLDSILPTETERRLFADHLQSDEPVVGTVERAVQTGETESLDLTIVPVPSSGPVGAVYGVYNCEETRLLTSFDSS
ncbi:GAF domain-containing protein [Halogeometricum rufum]|uniref:GAF domain-containing protein n=1 Tax=Halogeometricum rufum TaxID=553469 RepID=A0A1I6GG23_9EURY|nr:GAF domain-containing protein [Halogeometricum rufum]SFR41037.1 GAF domain-containing protein [Halogeometricum rufum]